MGDFRFKPEAVEDLDGILAHSAQNWGEGKAAETADALQSTLENLSDYPDLGKSYTGKKHAGVELRLFQIGSHVVFYRKLGDQSIEIVRILYKSRLPSKHL